MASKIVRSAVHKVTPVKSIASPLAISGPNGLQVSKLRNGITVGTVESNSPLARVAVFARAGSRYDTIPGISHVVNMCIAGEMGAEEYTNLNLLRTREQSGSSLQVVRDRELAVYTMTNNKDKILDMVSHLSSLTSNITRFHYEFPTHHENIRMKASISLSAEEQVWDMAIKAAFRAQPLGNSLYVPDYKIGKISADEVNQYVKDTHGSQGLVIIGAGVSQEDLEDSAGGVGVPSGGEIKSAADTKYFGGDIRHQTGSSQAHVAVLGQGAKMGTAEGLACQLAAEILATNPGTMYGSNSYSPLVQSLKGAVASVEGVSQSFTDAGVLGFVLHASGADAPQAVMNCVASAKKYKATDKDVAGAKARVKASLLQCEGFGGIDNVGRQILLSGSYTSPIDVIKMLDGVNTAAVNKALSTAFSGKLTVAALGDINHVPYSDTL